MNKQLHLALTKYFGSEHFYKKDVVQSLWSGYGEIARFAQHDAADTCIVKWVDVGATRHHPRGWNTNTSHQRKISSYVNEQRFYHDFSQFTTHSCRTPRHIAQGNNGDVLWQVMEDLDAAGYAVRKSSASLIESKTVLNWLAHFHAAFLHVDRTTLWSEGNYWHLSTRLDELASMPEDKLKHNAESIDAQLRNANYKTLLHGDAKLANFCFDDAGQSVAAVDFQYVGSGAAIIDVVYFLGSCFDDTALNQYAEEALASYFAALKKLLLPQYDTKMVNALIAESMSLYAFAWADFERFLSGWSPGHKKLTGYSDKQTQFALSAL